jgi:hypothetical protein
MAAATADRLLGSGGAPSPSLRPKPLPHVKITATPYVWRDPKTIDPRDFLYGDDIVRRYVSSIVAMGGIGKTSEIQVEIAAMVTGRDLLGVKPKRACRVWYINLEDPLDEIDRRFAAVFKEHRITKQDLGNRLFRDSGRKTAEQPGKNFVVAREGRNGIEFDQAVIDNIIETIEVNAIDYLVVDPFANSARFAENDNNKMTEVIDTVWAAIAERTNCAVMLLHHVRKGGSGHGSYTVEDARGAGALVNCCRSVRVLNTMQKDEGEKAGVERHRSFFRIDSGKTNIAIAPENSEWRKIVSVDLDNAKGDCPADRVGVVTLWKWPDPLATITVADLRAAQKAVSEGGPWRANIQAKDWVGKPIAKALHLDLNSKTDKAKIKGALQIWTDTGMFKEVEQQKDKWRKPKKCIEVGQWANDGQTERLKPSGKAKVKAEATVDGRPVSAGARREDADPNPEPRADPSTDIVEINQLRGPHQGVEATLAQIAAVLTAWREELGMLQGLTVQELVETEAPALRAALLAVAPLGRDGEIANSVLFRWLEKVEGIFVDGLKLGRSLHFRDGSPVYTLEVAEPGK